VKLLRYSNRKIDDRFWDISTPEKEQKAFLKLFREFDGPDWRMYEASPLTGAQKKLYQKAKDGDADAARKLLTLRKGYEYEEWSIVETETEVE
jgi:hypothetical protein